jgi:hypothetical protein
VRRSDRYKRPSALSTNWLKYSCITAGIAVGVLSVVKRREDIIDWLVDFKVLAKNFIQKNILLVPDPASCIRTACAVVCVRVWSRQGLVRSVVHLCESTSDTIVLFTQPLQDVYETIRYEKRAFTIMDARYENKTCDLASALHSNSPLHRRWTIIGRSMLMWSRCSAWSTNTSARYTVPTLSFHLSRWW